MHNTLLVKIWARFWMSFAGLTLFGRFATRMATWFAPPHKSRVFLSRMNPHGFIAPGAIVHHDQLRFGGRLFVDDGVVLFQREGGGPLEIGERVCIYRHVIIETGFGGSLTICDDASIHPRCQINAYVAPVTIGRGVMLAPNCAIYSYDHGVAPNKPIIEQSLESSGPVVIGDGAWLGFGVIVLSGVRIGKGAVVAAGSLVTSDVPDNAIVGSTPARVLKMR